MSKRLRPASRLDLVRARSGAVLVVLLAMFAVGATLASGAYAAPNWKVKGAFLKKGEVAKAKITGEVKWTWADGLTVTCKTKAKEELIGIGEDQYNSYLYEGCIVNNPANCKVKEVTALNVGTPKWHTALLKVGAKFFVEVEKAEVEVVVEGVGCPGALTRSIKGNWRYEWANAGGPLVAEGQKLESNEAVTATGEESLELESGGTLEVGEEEKGLGPCAGGGSHFVFCTNPGNVPIVHELILGSGGLFLLAATISGGALKLHCESGDVHGEIELLGAGSGALILLNCKEEKPIGCKLSTAEEASIIMGYDSQQENATLMEFTGRGTGEEFFTLNIEKKTGETCALEGSFPMTGKQMAKSPNGGTGEVSQEITTTKSESSLKFGLNVASLSYEEEVHLGGVNLGSAFLVMEGE